MAKPHVYINLSQTLAIAGATVLGLRYLQLKADAVGIQKQQFADSIKEDAANVIGMFKTPFAHWF